MIMRFSSRASTGFTRQLGSHLALGDSRKFSLGGATCQLFTYCQLPIYCMIAPQLYSLRGFLLSLMASFLHFDVKDVALDNAPLRHMEKSVI